MPPKRKANDINNVSESTEAKNKQVRFTKSVLAYLNRVRGPIHCCLRNVSFVCSYSRLAVNDDSGGM
jgi:hypothetical protein